MALPALVLVHGGSVAADCWDPTIAEIHRLDPERNVLAVDLPGRRGKSGGCVKVNRPHCDREIWPRHP
jgi:pimeloyl-ACP methyl ester carboxylesterase